MSLFTLDLKTIMLQLVGKIFHIKIYIPVIFIANIEGVLCIPVRHVNEPVLLGEGGSWKHEQEIVFHNFSDNDW